MTQIPTLPGGFSPEFLTDILHESGALPAAGRVISIARAQVGDGTGMMAELSKLLVEYAGEQGDAPNSFIAKYASQNETNREIALSYNLHERESRFVRELGPQTAAYIPKAYFSGLDEDRFLILMDDLTDYEVGSQVTGATLAQTTLAIDELAKLHSAFWHRVDALDWVPGIANSYHADNMQTFAKMGIDAVIEKFGDFLAEELKDQRRHRFLEAIPAMQARMMSAPITLVHGDFRMENLLYGCQPNHAPRCRDRLARAFISTGHE